MIPNALHRHASKWMIFPLLMICGLCRAQGVSATQPALNPNLPTLWIIGDSTVKNGHDTGTLGQWGWGNPIASFFDRAQINVVNCALGGTSSRTFYMRDLWSRVLPQIKKGDFVLMQFGHNDGGPLDDRARARGSLPGNGEETREIDNPITQKHEVVHTYGWYLRQFIADAKGNGAASIICSPIPRDRWMAGQVDAETRYPQWASQAAAQAGAYFIDLHDIITGSYEAIGQDKVAQTLFPLNEYTHTNWAGAVFNAQCVVDGIVSLKDCDLAGYLLPNRSFDLPPPGGRALKVACVGDSITYGGGTTAVAGARPNSYPSQLQRMLGDKYDVRNFGVGGATLLNHGDKPYQKQAAFRRALDEQPDIVIVMLGANDTKPWNWRWAGDFAADYGDLVSQFLSLDSKPRVWLCCPCPVPADGNYAINEAGVDDEIPLIDDLAREMQLSVIDIHGALQNHADLIPDRVHPNNEGATLMARAAYRALIGKDYSGPSPVTPPPTTRPNE
jgi:rhamnogalacturonan acetylesterase